MYINKYILYRKVFWNNDDIKREFSYIGVEFLYVIKVKFV